MIYFVTGGAGFIGSNFLDTFVPRNPKDIFINIDCLTYAGNLGNLKSIDEYRNYFFENVDITNYEDLEVVFKKYMPDVIVHFAAESHVDRSIMGPGMFVKTNIVGTFNLLELARIYWKGREDVLFHHVSTDEVYGSLGKEGLFSETTAYSPNSPYSASKAGSDHLVRAYYHTFGLPITVTNCSNNYGPFQHREKLIPSIVYNILNGEPIPIYGNGLNVRDWLYVIDHCEAIWTVIQKGKRGSTYNVGGRNELTNIEVVYSICDIISKITGKNIEEYKKLIKFVEDRPGHDLRYAIDATKITSELGWKPMESFDTGILKTVKWYMENK